MSDHWRSYGRNFYSRFDYEAIPVEAARAVIETVRGALATLPGSTYAGLKAEKGDEFSYLDPVDGTTSENQGLRIWFEGGRRAVFRLSGTGTQGATIRVYLEQYLPPQSDLQADTLSVLEPLVSAVLDLSPNEISDRTNGTGCQDLSLSRHIPGSSTAVPVRRARLAKTSDPQLTLF